MKVTIRLVNITPEGAYVSLETDLPDSNGGMIMLSLTLQKKDFTDWLSDNAGKTLKEYIFERAKASYLQTKKLSDASANLVGQSYTSP